MFTWGTLRPLAVSALRCWAAVQCEVICMDEEEEEEKEGGGMDQICFEGYTVIIIYPISHQVRQKDISPSNNHIYHAHLFSPGLAMHAFGNERVENPHPRP